MVNILIVDDEKKICEFIKAFLDNEGYYTEVAYDGKSAIDKFNSKKYNLIILMVKIIKIDKKIKNTSLAIFIKLL